MLNREGLEPPMALYRGCLVNSSIVQVPGRRSSLCASLQHKSRIAVQKARDRLRCPSRPDFSLEYPRYPPVTPS